MLYLASLISGIVVLVVTAPVLVTVAYIALAEGKATTRYPWLTPQFYSDHLQVLLNRSYSSLEWALTSPPKPHAFLSLPLQSKIGLKSFNKHLILTNVITGIVIFIAFFYFRSYIFPEACIEATFRLLDHKPSLYSINKDFFLGLLAVICRLSLKGFVEDCLAIFLLPQPTVGISDSRYFMTSNPPIDMPASSSTLPESYSQLAMQIANDTLHIENFYKQFDLFKIDMDKYTELLTKRNNVFQGDTVSLDSPEVASTLVLLLQDQTQLLNSSILRRIKWVKCLTPGLPLNVNNEIDLLYKNIVVLQGNMTDELPRIIAIKDDKQQAKAYFSLLNGYRNNVRKELVKLETVAHHGFKNSAPQLYRMKQFKKLINVDVPKTINDVVEQDSYLKAKISKIINAQKK